MNGLRYVLDIDFSVTTAKIEKKMETYCKFSPLSFMVIGAKVEQKRSI